MTSPLLALFTRAVRADTRGPATYAARSAMGGLLLVVVFIFGAANRWSGAPGLIFFVIAIVLQLIVITFVGLSYFTSAIAEEKEEQTLGLLRMTGLNPLSILLGKSTSRLYGALLLLVAQLPFTAFAITLGGVSVRQIAAAHCTLGSFVFLLSNLALLGSVLARRTAGAVAFCLAAMVFLLTVGPLLGAVYAFVGDEFGLGPGTDRVAAALWDATPIARLIEVLTTGFAGPPVGWQVATNLLLGAICFLLAWAAFERFSDRAGARAVAVGLPPLTGTTGNRRTGMSWVQPPRVWNDALLWKDFHFLCGARVGFIVRTLGYGGALLACVYAWYERPFGFTGLAKTVSVCAFFVFSIDIAAMAARIFRWELDQQTLTGLAALPLTMKEIAHRKLLACLLAASPGLVATSLMSFFLDPLPSTVTTGSTTSIVITPTFVATITNWGLLILLAHVVAWFSLSMKRGALPIGYLVTWLGYWIVLGVCTIFAMLPTFPFGPEVSNAMVGIGGPMLAAAVCLTAAWSLRKMIGIQLEYLAGEN